MLNSKISSVLLNLSRPTNLLRLGLLSFIITSLFLRLPIEWSKLRNPDIVLAGPTCSDGKCESAGHCWSQGTKAGNGDNGCEYTCRDGQWKDENCNTSQQFKDTAKSLKNQYEQQVAAAGGGGGAATAPTQTGIGVTGGAVCGSGSASGCSGKSFYSEPTGAPGWKCYPNGMNSQGVTLCGRTSAANVPTATTTNGQTVGGYLVPNCDNNTTGSTTCVSRSTGGCANVIHCGCATGMQSTCLRDGAAPSNPSEYCARVVCAPIGSGGKICTPGQVEPGSCGRVDSSDPAQAGKAVSSTLGKICNADGKSYSWVNTHACGARHTVSYCARPTCIRSSERYPNCPGGVTCQGVTYNSQSACERETNSGCTLGVSQVTQSVTVVSAFCSANCGGPTRDACISGCIRQINTNPNSPEKQLYDQQVAAAQSSGGCIPFASYKTFDGCGGPGSRYNCYKICSNGTLTRQCWNEPGLSCGAFQNLTPTQAAIAAVVQARTIVNPTPPPPTPTPTPTATCGESCGNGVVCTGSNMACVAGTCRSTLCAPADQNNQCVCNPPPPVAPMCIDIWASKTAPALNDQVTFTCAQVNNTERYEFRYAFTTNKTSLTGAQVYPLAPASTTSNVSQPITIDKVGRYIVQCRPCGPNNLCQEWEPLDGQIGPPELAPENAAAAAASSAAGTSQTNNQSTSQTATESGQTATSSGTTQ